MEMNVNDLQVLEEMAVKLEASARKSARGRTRDDLLRDVATFRAHLAVRLASAAPKAEENNRHTRANASPAIL